MANFVLTIWDKEDGSVGIQYHIHNYKEGELSEACFLGKTLLTALETARKEAEKDLTHEEKQE